MQLAVGVLGVLVITGEYATGMIRGTLGATRRAASPPCSDCCWCSRARRGASNAWQVLRALRREPHPPVLWTGIAVFLLYAPAALAAAVTLKRRDA